MTIRLSEGQFAQLAERLTHDLHQIQGHRRGAALWWKDGGEFEIDPRQEMARDDASAGELLRRERIADCNAKPGRHQPAHDLRQAGLDPQDAANIITVESLVDQMAAG